MGCCSSASSAAQSSKREWKPLEDRSCTDIPWLLLFILFCIGMGFICGFSIATGAAARLVSGYDSYGNICGQKNAKLEGIPNSGMDHTQRKCSALCSYNLKPSEYTTSSKSSVLCPKLPVPASAPIPFFHRCAPVNISCYAKFAEALITFVSDNSVLHRLISGVMTSKEIILGLCLLSLVLSMILMVIIRYISRVLVWILTILVILGSLGGTGVLWWLYAKQRRSPKETVIPEQLQIAEDNLRALLIYAISATVFTVILFLIMLVMRKRVALTIALFHVAGKVFIHLPLLVFQPFWTFFALVLFWVYWIMTLLFLGTTEHPSRVGLNQNAYTATAINSTNFCTSAKDAFVILVENALRLLQVLIVCSTGLAGIMLLNYQQDYTVWVLPLIIVCLFAFLVAHCFLSIYEMVVDVLFLCFAVDTKYNDGSPGREFYMDKVLMEFVENSRKAMKEAGKGGAADARELKPMASGASSA
ncbi:PREDICTED: choline transporter-like protein 1 [Propithecus coquereli]|uniref:choline transporter-like protein 1 n=1 Tax=Propithecus coquereli TaxID=379532 RepID=UPI00063FA982|nr:PREDICTED: choline transporter-like protein 1 [Propithecus coquereli]